MVNNHHIFTKEDGRVKIKGIYVGLPIEKLKPALLEQGFTISSPSVFVGDIEGLGNCRLTIREGQNTVGLITIRTERKCSEEEVRAVIDAFPDKYKVPGEVVMFVPAAVNRAVRRELTDNQDKYGGLYEITATGDIVFEDVTFITIPAFSVPKNTFSDKPFIIATKENIQWLADPDNIEVEAQFVLRSNAWDIASTIYADINYAFSDAIAIGTVKEA